MVISNMCFFTASYLQQDGGVKLFCIAMVGVTPYKLSLKVPWVNKQIVSFDFTLRKR
jgi:hypothetical protein